MNATLDLPITLERLTPEEIKWIAARSAQSGKSTAEIVKDAFRRGAGIRPDTKPARKGARLK